MVQVLDELRAELIASIDDHTKNTSQRHFKERVRVYGVKTSIVTRIAKKYYENIETFGKNIIFTLCEDLFESGLLEKSFIACKWSEYVHRQYKGEDISVFERWVDTYIDNWVTCDTLCNHTVGAFIEMYPQYVERLMGWAQSENMWMRRASAVSLIIPAKKGLFLNEAFMISDLLMDDTEDLVQKGFGWLLKEESRLHQKEVYEYVLKKRPIMPRTALRYAIKLMPDGMRKEAMRKVSTISVC